MLTYNSLIEEAKNRNMPVTKTRGILREYLQVLILKKLCQREEGKKLYFTGRTYLRLVHNLKRFSEDLDFNTDSIKKKEFENLINSVAVELRRINIDSRALFKHWGNIYCSQLIFPDIEKIYKVTSPYSKKEGIIIKIETNRPIWKIKKETEVISGFAEVYPCLCTAKSALFADKIDALNKKERGRHIYDIIFMLSHKYAIDKNVLSKFKIGNNPLEIIRNRIKSFSTVELKKQAENLRPFLFEEEEADLIVKAKIIITGLLEKYRKN